MNAIFEVLTAVLIMIPVFLDYPEDGDSKLRTKLWCLNDLSQTTEIFTERNVKRIGYEDGRCTKVTQDYVQLRFRVLPVQLDVLDGDLIHSALSTWWLLVCGLRCDTAVCDKLQKSTALGVCQHESLFSSVVMAIKSLNI